MIPWLAFLRRARCSLGRIFRPWYYSKDRKRITVKSWYAEWTDAAGRTRRKKVGASKKTATAFLARMEDAAERERAGLGAAPTADARTLPLDTLKREYLELLAAKDTKAAYRDNIDFHLDAIFVGCSWLLFTDISADSFSRYLGRRRDADDIGLSTLNGYIRSAKGFVKWLAKRLRTVSPLEEIRPYPEETDRRRSKRILTDDEFAALLWAAENCPPRGDAHFRGPDRAALYRVAAYTGLRAGELATLTPAHFALDSTPPVVTVAARDAKGKREEPIPLPSHLVAFLRVWLADREMHRRLWPGEWAANRRQIRWLERDVRRAKITELDQRGRRVTFHSLKRRYVVGLIKAGAKIHEVRRLARHKDVRTTLGYYTDESLPDLAELADRLPPPPILGGHLAGTRTEPQGTTESQAGKGGP